MCAAGLNSLVLASNNEMVILPVNEPTFGTPRKSQIQVREDAQSRSTPTRLIWHTHAGRCAQPDCALPGATGHEAQPQHGNPKPQRLCFDA